MSSPQRWQQIEKLYNPAVTLPPEDREPLLAAVDTDVRREVESLLRQEPSTATPVAPDDAYSTPPIEPRRGAH